MDCVSRVCVLSKTYTRSVTKTKLCEVFQCFIKVQSSLNQFARQIYTCTCFFTKCLDLRKDTVIIVLGSEYLTC
mgnify:CR=1 FL=1